MGIFTRASLRAILRTFASAWSASKLFHAIATLALSFRKTTPTGASAIEDLDAVLIQAFSLEDFLANAEAVELYFRSLVRYFGSERFNRRSYYAILEQLRTVTQAVPGFSDNVWRESPPSLPFEIRTAGQSTGRNLDLTLWKLYRFQWLSSLKSNGGLKYGTYDLSRLTAEAKDYLTSLQIKIRQFEAEIRRPGTFRVSRREGAYLRSKFYRGFQNDSTLKRIASMLLYSHLTSSQNQHFFQLSDPDLLVAFFKDLKQNPRHVMAHLPTIPMPSAVISAIKSLIPSAHDLLSDQKMFPPRTTQNARGKAIRIAPTTRAVYQTRFIRPFHALWLGIAENDCLAGDPAFIEYLTPERWAVSALEGVMTAVIEKNGHYQGFARCVPLRTLEHKLYASLELWSSVMMSRIVLVDDPRNEKKSQIFFDAWFPKFRQVLPKSWDGVVVSESMMIDNIGIKRTLTHSPFWVEGSEFGSSLDLHHVDLLVNDIKKVIKPKGPALRYCADMIFDAKIPDAGKLRLLADSASHADALKDCSKVEIESRGTLGEVSPTQSKKKTTQNRSNGSIS